MLNKLLVGLISIGLLSISQSVQASTVVEADSLVIDPPSNVRIAPNGRVSCQVRQRKIIQVFQWSLMTGEGSPSDGWYSTNACGENKKGWIHDSQIKILEEWHSRGSRTGIVTDPPSNIRAKPNGEIVCQVRNGNEVIDVNTDNRIGNWYWVTYSGCDGYMHDSQFKIVYPY